MGDIADWMRERMLDRWPDLPYDDEEYEWGGAQPRSDPRCRFCGERCTWVDTGRRWALQGRDGQLHDCRRATPDEFDVIDPLLT